MPCGRLGGHRYWIRTSNSHWYHSVLHDAFGVIRSKINFFSGGKVCLVVASGGGGGHVPLLPPLVGPALSCPTVISSFWYYILNFVSRRNSDMQKCFALS